MARFVSRGDVVFLKANMGWARTSAQGANTHPDVIAALVQLCFEAGARQVKVADHTLDLARRCYQRSGIAAAAREAGAEVAFIDAAEFRQVRLGGEFVKDWLVYKDALEADKLINAPVAKHHNLCRMTMAMKNWFGMLGGERNRLHEHIHVAVADLAQFFKADLTVLDATRVLFRNGPQGGSLADVREAEIVAASADPVAIDAYGATLLGLSAGDVDYVEIAHRRGLGNMNLDELQIAERRLA